MLVLSRVKDEVIEISPDIEVMVVEVRTDGRVRLGITAPRDTSIFRKEIADAIRYENREAAKVVTNP